MQNNGEGVVDLRSIVRIFRSFIGSYGTFLRNTQ